MSETSDSSKPLSPKPSDLRFPLRALLFFVCLVSVVLAIVAVGVHRDRELERRDRELERLAKVDAQTLAQLIVDVAAIRTQLGRAPRDTDELELLLGRKLPVVHEMGYPHPIHYHRKGERSYTLWYSFWATDDWVYDSDKPAAGWVQHFF